MSKKDKKKKSKDKHSENGAKKKDKARIMPVSVTSQIVSSVPTEDQFPINKKSYEKELARLQVELIKLQEWIRFKKLKVVIIFEGRDAAGKGGAIKRITESSESARLPCGGAACANRTGKDSMVFPALCSSSAGRRRNGAPRPQLV